MTRTPLFAVIILICAIALPRLAAADCKDHPEAGVDWEGCFKARLILDDEDLSALLTRIEINW